MKRGLMDDDVTVKRARTGEDERQSHTQTTVAEASTPTVTASTEDSSAKTRSTSEDNPRRTLQFFCDRLLLSAEFVEKAWSMFACISSVFPDAFKEIDFDRICVYLIWVTQRLDPTPTSSNTRSRTRRLFELLDLLPMIENARMSNNYDNNSNFDAPHLAILHVLHELGQFVEIYKACTSEAKIDSVSHTVRQLIGLQGNFKHWYDSVSMILQFITPEGGSDARLARRDIHRYTWLFFLATCVQDRSAILMKLASWEEVVHGLQQHLCQLYQLDATRVTERAQVVLPQVLSIMDEKNIIKFEDALHHDLLVWPTYRGLLASDRLGYLQLNLDNLNKYYYDNVILANETFQELDPRHLLPSWRIIATPKRYNSSTKAPSASVMASAARNLKVDFARASVFNQIMPATPITARNFTTATSYTESAEAFQRRLINLFLNKSSDSEKAIIALCNVNDLRPAKAMIMEVTGRFAGHLKQNAFVATGNLDRMILNIYYKIVDGFLMGRARDVVGDRHFHSCVLLSAHEIVRQAFDSPPYSKMISFDDCVKLLEIRYMELAMILDLVVKAEAVW
ncbi:hypothetical protein HDU76_008112, partial [Blyttiomyces sp. JEL0837]